MIPTNFKNILAVDASSPEELTKKLSQLKVDGKPGFISFAICGPRVLIRPFHFDNVPLKEVKNRLKMEAVELLSLGSDEIVFDYQILKSTIATVEGVFVCAPDKLMDEYCAVLKNAKLTPLKVTAYPFARMNAFFHKHKNIAGRFCLLDFTKDGKINLAVFTKYQYELLREIPYADSQEAITEVIQSLRSANAKSPDKGFKNIYWSGDFDQKKELIKELEGFYKIKVTPDDEDDVCEALRLEENYFHLNLAGECFCSSRQRKMVLTVSHVLIGLFLLNAVILGVKMVKNNMAIKNVKGSFTAKEYQYAQRLHKDFKRIRK